MTQFFSVLAVALLILAIYLSLRGFDACSVKASRRWLWAAEASFRLSGVAGLVALISAFYDAFGALK